MGYPGRNKEISLPVEKSEKFLWFQKDAKIYGDVKGTSEMGVATNAIAYKGMSGGGCVFSDSPRVLVGVLTNNNDLNGHSAIQIDKNMPIEQGANYLSTFHKLEARYNLMHMKEGKTLANIDKECDWVNCYVGSPAKPQKLPWTLSIFDFDVPVNSREALFEELISGRS